MHFVKIILLVMLTQTLFAERVEITSTSMEAEELKKEVHFIGNAKIKKGDDWLHADRVIVYFDDNNETKKYEAMGSVKFEFKKDEKHFKGSADKVEYNTVQSLYVLIGKAILDDLVKKSHLNGDKIILDMSTGSVDVKGNRKKPAKFIFDMKDE
ncbi:lipopolysaccharide transport periplasmic protein LptA [Sulfurovum sp. XTW-4]|uniref:Lipopolysaccharide transport periplasmic protein LptA n=1 Tax=Sulfurovum xiamenensis TaxID=3019066 RepID=A0ABT7QTE7_9BACT|nr:lipopolysaccharide transport periplasmic protein LptA [Sulfurovum xiamenensis]MDM5264338.1 lipopolysaccharide transport periplasmic protein LptA [Sulfurovum xiamenensis]